MIPAKIEYLYRVSINQSHTPEGLTVIFSYCLLIEGLSTIEKKSHDYSTAFPPLPGYLPPIQRGLTTSRRWHFALYCDMKAEGNNSVTKI